MQMTTSNLWLFFIFVKLVIIVPRAWTLPVVWLRPTLFILFINDLCHVSEDFLSDRLEILQRVIKKRWRKWKFAVIGRSYPSTLVRLNVCLLIVRKRNWSREESMGLREDENTFFGMVTDDWLSWKSHMRHGQSQVGGTLQDHQRWTCFRSQVAPQPFCNCEGVTTCGGKLDFKTRQQGQKQDYREIQWWCERNLIRELCTAEHWRRKRNWTVWRYMNLK